MIKTSKAFTYELDNADVAVSEIVSQLKLDSSLCRNTIGILLCHTEFVISGVARAVSSALPFDVVGVSTTGQATPDDENVFALSVTVLTSDTVRFSAAHSSSVSDSLEEPLAGAYNAAFAAAGRRPELMLAFAPMLLNYAGDQYVEVLDRISGGVPVFGTLSMEDRYPYENCYTIFNDLCEQNTAVLVLVSGDISPKFFASTSANQRALTRGAVITKSRGNLIIEINGCPLIQYLEEMGLAVNGQIKPGLIYIMFLLDYNDGTPPAGKVLITINEDGHGVCGGYMPEGCHLFVTSMSREEVLETAGNVIDCILKSYDESVDVLIAFSCSTRYLSLGGDNNAEYRAVERAIGGKVPSIIALSGGEICPYVASDGTIRNRFHNHTLTVCTF